MPLGHVGDSLAIGGDDHTLEESTLQSRLNRMCNQGSAGERPDVLVRNALGTAASRNNRDARSLSFPVVSYHVSRLSSLDGAGEFLWTTWSRRQKCATRNDDDAPFQAFGDLESHPRCLLEGGELMKQGPGRPGHQMRVVACLEDAFFLIGQLVIEKKCIEPIVAARERWLLKEGHALDRTKNGSIPIGKHSLSLKNPRQFFHLCATQRRIQVRHPIVVADLVMEIVPLMRQLRRRRDVPGTISERFIVREDGASASRRDGLVSVEAQDCGPAPIPSVAPAVERSESFRGIFDDSAAKFGAHVDQWLEIDGMAECMHGRDGTTGPPGVAVVADAPRNSSVVVQILFELEGVESESPFFTVHEVRYGAAICHRVRSGYKGQRLDEHLVAGLHTDQLQGDVEGRR